MRLRKPLGVFLVVALVGSGGLILGFRLGAPLLDRACSQMMKAVLGHPVTVERVHWTGIDGITFERVSIKNSAGLEILRARRGSAHLFSKRLQMKGLEIDASTASKVPIVSSLLSRWKNKTIRIQNLILKLSRQKSFSTVHILKCRSTDFSLKGGVRFEQRTIQKAHVMVLIPRHRFLELPKVIRVRLLRRPHAFFGARLVWSRKQFVVIGAHGPFFKAQWRTA